MEPIAKTLPLPIDDMDQKTIQFRFMVDRMKMTEGNGILHVSGTLESGFSVTIMVDIWPESGVGEVTIHELNLHQRVVDLIRKTPDEEFELSCVDQSIPDE